MAIFTAAAIGAGAYAAAPYIYGGAVALREGLAWKNMYDNRNRDPNAVVTEDTMRQQMMTPEQQRLRGNELNQGMGMLTNRPRIYRQNGMRYMRAPQAEGEEGVGENRRLQPLGNLSNRLLDFEQAQMGGGLRSDYGDVENTITGLNPMGLESSGRQAMRGEAFKGRFNQTAIGQMQMLSGFAADNYMTRMHGDRMDRLRGQVNNQIYGQGMGLQRDQQAVGQNQYMANRVLGTNRTGMLNEAENQRRAAANRQYGYGMTTSNRYQQAPPLLK